MEENRTDAVEREIDLKIIFDVLRRNILPIILVTVIVAGMALVGSMLFLQKQYEAYATLIVNNEKKDSSPVNSNEIVAAQSLADVYAIIIKSDTVLQKVIDDLKLNMTYEELSKAISVSSVNNTQVIRISMQNSDKDFAKKVIEDVIEVAPPIIKEKVEAGSVQKIDDARFENDGNPVSPSLSRNTLLGALAGLVLILIIVFLKEFLNNTFKTEEDVMRTLNIPLLGVIPVIDEKEFSKS